MDRNRSGSGWRASAVAAALLAITFAVLQPLAHAALMRGGPAGTTDAAWWWGTSAPCFADGSLADGSQDSGDRDRPAPAGRKLHDCCLGLTHIPALAAPSTAFVVVPRLVAVVVAIAPVDDRSAAAIRDGPSQPRGPPSAV